MTERKPAGINFETWVERQIREAMDRGEFDDLPGAGKPIPDLDKPYDELWVQRSIRGGDLSTEALLPTPLRLRKEIAQLPDTVRELPSEDAVRDAVLKLNMQVMEWLRAPIGPQVPVAPVHVDDVVAQWRADRRRKAPGAGGPEPAEQATTHQTLPQRPRWWRRIARRRQESGWE